MDRKSLNQLLEKLQDCKEDHVFAYIAWGLLSFDTKLNNRIAGCFDGSMTFAVHPNDKNRAYELIIELNGFCSKEFIIALFTCYLQKNKLPVTEEYKKKIVDVINEIL
ncbi:hypothetical protein [Butyricimonas paravirosa]